jgi:hypothetical protein
MAKEGHLALRPSITVRPMHSATRLVPLSNSGARVTEMVVDSRRTEAVYKITARIPTSPRIPRLRAVSILPLTISSKPFAALGTAGVRTDGGVPGPIHETRPLRRERWGPISNPRQGMSHSAISGRCVWQKRNGMKREGKVASLGPRR